jgi:preprotein translocase subunit YajC
VSPIIVAAIISGSAVVVSSGVALAGVVITIRAQTRHIDQDNKAALAAQTSDIKQHLEKGGPR